MAEYTLSLEGVLPPRVVVAGVDGGTLYTLKWGPRHRQPECVVANPSGKWAFEITKGRPPLAQRYTIARSGMVFGRAGSNWRRSRGFVHVAPLPRVDCAYGWGFKTSMSIEADSGRVGRFELLGGLPLRARLTIDREDFDTPAFVVACALIFREWTSRG